MIESKYLKDSVQNMQKMMTIPPLRKFETGGLRQLLVLSRMREYEPDEVIIREGDRDHWLYFLLSGKARVEKQGEQITVIDQIGQIFGEMSLLDGMVRSASVYAVTRTACLAVDTSARERLTGGDDRLQFLIMLYRMFAEFLSTRLRITSEELVKAKKEIRRLSQTDRGQMTEDRRQNLEP